MRELALLEPELLGAAERLEALLRGVRELTDQAYRNDLTGLLNRRALVGLTQELLARSEDAPAVAYQDLTGFKAINDEHGHDAGDAALREIGAAWSLLCQRFEAIPFHLSGDEYVAVMSDRVVDNFLEAWRRECAERSFAHNDQDIVVRTNVGLARPEGGLNIESLRQRAEDACVLGKLTGSREPVVWSPDVASQASRSARWRCSCGASTRVNYAGAAPAALHCPVCGVAAQAAVSREGRAG